MNFDEILKDPKHQAAFDKKVAIALSGILAGGSYDILHNLDKMIRKKG